MAFREREALRLCLKHFRQRNYLEIYEDLQKASGASGPSLGVPERPPGCAADGGAAVTSWSAPVLGRARRLAAIAGTA